MDYLCSAPVIHCLPVQIDIILDLAPKLRSQGSKTKVNSQILWWSESRKNSQASRTTEPTTCVTETPSSSQLLVS